jgi:hypothetical protein
MACDQIHVSGTGLCRFFPGCLRLRQRLELDPRLCFRLFGIRVLQPLLLAALLVPTTVLATTRLSPASLPAATPGKPDCATAGGEYARDKASRRSGSTACDTSIENGRTTEHTIVKFWSAENDA